jgi:type II secretory pathway component GspD/PulD (secretin)
MAAGALENRLFDLQHRRAEDVIAQLRELYGSAIQLSANGQTLVVRATPERVTEIEALLPQIDQPPRQVHAARGHAGEPQRFRRASRPRL